jgi:hypothetical protein
MAKSLAKMLLEHRLQRTRLKPFMEFIEEYPLFAMTCSSIRRLVIPACIFKWQIVIRVEMRKFFITFLIGPWAAFSNTYMEMMPWPVLAATDANDRINEQRINCGG